MRRVAVVAAAAVLGAAAAGCGAEGQRAVARVGDGGKVTREQLDQAVEHFQEEAKREGKAFADGPAARKNLLGLLLYRARLEQGAAALGITISRDQVERRLAATGSAEEGGSTAKEAEAFVQSSVRAQLLTEAVYRKLADPIRDADPQRRQAKRNAALRRWIASLSERFPAH
jgi:hypothetical protein